VWIIWSGGSLQPVPGTEPLLELTDEPPEKGMTEHQKLYIFIFIDVYRIADDANKFLHILLIFRVLYTATEADPATLFDRFLKYGKTMGRSLRISDRLHKLGEFTYRVS